MINRHNTHTELTFPVCVITDLVRFSEYEAVITLNRSYELLGIMAKQFVFSEVHT
jgi:hypothetical protein